MRERSVQWVEGQTGGVGEAKRGREPTRGWMRFPWRYTFANGSIERCKMMRRGRMLIQAIAGNAHRVGFTLILSIVIAGCDAAPGSDSGSGLSGPSAQPDLQLECDIPLASIFVGNVGRDGILSLVNPPLVAADDLGAGYLTEYAAIKEDQVLFPELRVVGIVIDGEPIAVPHNILWYHEIVNLDIGFRRYAISYCPLTGSAIVFDATAAGTERFGVSGLIYNNNLIMFDPETESLWPQMSLSARCGRLRGTKLLTMPSIDMRWDAWKELHPDTKVVSQAANNQFNYTAYPYDLYESAPLLLFPQEVDRRRNTKERVLGIPDGAGGVAFPFDELEARGARVAARREVGGRELVVLWDSAARAARAYEGRSGSGPATLILQGTSFVDTESGSSWNLEGVAFAGSRAGEELLPVTDSFVAFWFAWAAFHPDTEVWR